MNEETARRIVKSRVTLSRYKAMGLPPGSGETLLRMFNEEIELLVKLRSEQGLRAVDDLIADWEMLRDRLKAMQQ
jgi:hypothetical protein